jgi:hypothetical protein
MACTACMRSRLAYTVHTLLLLYYCKQQHVMLQEAAQKIRKLRSEYKRRMDAEAKVTVYFNTLNFVINVLAHIYYISEVAVSVLQWLLTMSDYSVATVVLTVHYYLLSCVVLLVRRTTDTCCGDALVWIAHHHYLNITVLAYTVFVYLQAMTPAERTKALEEHTRKVYSIAATEGGIHLQR